MDLHHTTAHDVTRTSGWMAVHGHSVAAMVLNASMLEAQQLQWLWEAGPALTCLRRLEVEQDESLFLLEPVLGHLPHLQHLAAGVNLGPVEELSWPDDPSEVEDVLLGQFVHRSSDGSFAAWDVPDLQQLCPKLTHLRLTLYQGDDTLMVDEQLPRLLPAGLQQLSLAAGPYDDTIWLQFSSLVHLTAMQQLSLRKVRVEGPGPELMAQSLGALQQLRQLRLHHPYTWNLEGNVMLQLAPKVTSLGVFAWGTVVVDTLPHLVHLTQLVLSQNIFTKGLPEGTAEALAALTNLQQLHLACMPDDSLVPVLQQVAAMPALRSLQLRSFVDRPSSLGLSLAQCTQLTSLVIRQVTDSAGMCACVAALQQLTRLQYISIPVELLQHQGGAVLVSLTALTRLYVYASGMLIDDEGEASTWQRASVQRMLQQVQAWPAGLQQVVVGFLGGSTYSCYKPECWQVTPAGSGGVQFSVWLEEETCTARGWARPWQPCPHLPGVWELQGEVAGSNV
jgi:hypothetical protein